MADNSSLNNNWRTLRLESLVIISPNDYIFLSSVARILIFLTSSSVDDSSADNRVH